MKTRHPNPRLVKIHRNYSVEQIANLFDIHKNTVRAWIKQGLCLIDEGRPMLILGSDLQLFLQQKRTRNKRHCQPDELYCLRCRAPKRPAANMMEFQALTEKLGNLIAICPDCNSLMNKRYSMAKKEQLTALLGMPLTKTHEHIGDMAQLTLNSDFKREEETNEKTPC